jgi:hypothetical protein
MTNKLPLIPVHLLAPCCHPHHQTQIGALPMWVEDWANFKRGNRTWAESTMSESQKPWMQAFTKTLEWLASLSTRMGKRVSWHASMTFLLFSLCSSKASCLLALSVLWKILTSCRYPDQRWHSLSIRCVLSAKYFPLPALCEAQDKVSSDPSVRCQTRSCVDIIHGGNL